MTILIPMAGMGKRFSEVGYVIPKPFLPLGKLTMIQSVINNIYNDEANFIFVVNESQINPKALELQISEITNKFELMIIDHVPQGPAMSCLIARNKINNNQPLIITNCDQIIEDLNYEYFNNFIQFHRLDGCIGIFHSSNRKNSYVKVNDNNEIVDIKEKVIISNLATNGFHFWKRGSYFVESSDQMIKNNDTVNGEYYVAPSYNYMIQSGMKVMPYNFNMHFPIGIPEDYENYKKLRKL